MFDDVLVLRVENDKDYYVRVGGTFITSCFGQTLETLIRMTQSGRLLLLLLLMINDNDR